MERIFASQYDKDGIDGECDRQASSIARMSKMGIRPAVVGRRTAKVKATFRKQQPSSSSVIVNHAEKKTGLRSDPTYADWKGMLPEKE